MNEQERKDFKRQENHSAREIARMRALRQFEVTLFDRSKVTVTAHYHDSTAPAGHLTFTTLDNEGKPWVHDVYSIHEWRQCHEVTRASEKEISIQ